jgi:hypothetical protein
MATLSNLRIVTGGLGVLLLACKLMWFLNMYLKKTNRQKNRLFSTRVQG